MEKKKYKLLLQEHQQYNNQFKPENPLLTEQKLKDFDAELLKALLNEIKSTKNWLLIEQKRYSNPIEIAYRDGAIITVDILITKIVNILKNRVTDED